MNVPTNLRFITLNINDFQNAYAHDSRFPFWLEEVKAKKKRNAIRGYNDVEKPLHYFDASSLMSYQRRNSNIDVCMLVAKENADHDIYRIYAILELHDSTSHERGKNISYVSTRKGFFGKGLARQLLENFAQFYKEKYSGFDLRISYSTENDIVLEPTYDRVFMHHKIAFRQERGTGLSRSRETMAIYKPEMNNIQDVLISSILDKDIQNVINALDNGARPDQYNAALRHPLIMAMEKFPEALKILHPKKFTLSEINDLLPNATCMQAANAFHALAKNIGLSRDELYLAYTLIHAPGLAEKPPMHWNKTTSWTNDKKRVEKIVKNIACEYDPDLKDSTFFSIPNECKNDLQFFDKIVQHIILEKQVQKEACAQNEIVLE